MIKLSKKRPVSKDTDNWYKRGEYKGYSVAVNFNAMFNGYFFQIVKKEFSYASSWDDKLFNNENECITKCQEYIDKLED